MNHTDNEKKLREIMGSTQGHNPFRVPEGYFDEFPQRMMQRIRMDDAKGEKVEPDRHRILSSGPVRKHRLLIRLGSAAAIAGIFFLAWTVASDYRQPDVTKMAETPVTSTQEIEYTDELLDYAMVKNSDIEYYLTVAD